MAESEEELKSLLMKVKEESEKVGLKLNYQKNKIMASGPITSWQIVGKQWKQWEALFGGAPKSLQIVSAAIKLKDICSLEKNYIKRLFSSSSLSAIRLVSSAYLKLLILLPAILIPACASSSPAYLISDIGL